MILGVKGNFSRTDLEAFGAPCVVIGAGFLGITVALQLARAGVKVIVIPGGDDEFSAASSELAMGSNLIVELHESLDVNRPRVIGGNSKSWGGRIAGLDNDDFLAKPWLDLPSWPITKESLKPYLESAARLFGAKFFDTITDAERDSEAIEGFDNHEVVSDGLETWVKNRDFYRYHLRELEGSPQIMLARNFHAVRIFTKKFSQDFEAVEVGRVGEGTFKINSSFAVLAAGAIENAKMLLLLEQENPRGSLGRTSFVGKSYMTHTLTRIPSIKRPEGLDLDSVAYRGMQIKRSLRLTKELKEKIGIGNASVMFTPPDINLTSPQSVAHHGVRIIRKYGLQLPSKIWNYRSTVFQSLKNGESVPQNFDKQNHLPYLLLWGEHLPNSLSKISLGEKRDSFGQPLANATLVFSDLDKKTLLETAKAISRRLNQFRDIPIISDWLAISEKMECDLAEPNTHGHQIGGTIMGTSSENSVTDIWGETHEWKKVFCVGSSVFPTSGFAAPTLTAMALAIKTSEAIIQELKFN
jgi:hypothetical protein